MTSTRLKEPQVHFPLLLICRLTAPHIKLSVIRLANAVFIMSRNLMNCREKLLLGWFLKLVFLKMMQFNASLYFEKKAQNK